MLQKQSKSTAKAKATAAAAIHPGNSSFQTSDFIVSGLLFMVCSAFYNSSIYIDL